MDVNYHRWSVSIVAWAFAPPRQRPRTVPLLTIIFILQNDFFFFFQPCLRGVVLKGVRQDNIAPQSSDVYIYTLRKVWLTGIVRIPRGRILATAGKTSKNTHEKKAVKKKRKRKRFCDDRTGSPGRRAYQISCHIRLHISLRLAL